MKRHGELAERGFAHGLETGGMRRIHLRGRENVLERYLVHVAAFNVSLVMHTLLGVGAPRGLAGRFEALLGACCGPVVTIWARISLGCRAAAHIAISLWPTLDQRPVFAMGTSSTG